MSDVAKTLHDNFAKFGYPVTTWNIPWLLMWFASFFDSSAKVALSYWGQQKQYDNSMTRKILGIDFIKMEKSLK